MIIYGENTENPYTTREMGLSTGEKRNKGTPLKESDFTSVWKLQDRTNMVVKKTILPPPDKSFAKDYDGEHPIINEWNKGKLFRGNDNFVQHVDLYRKPHISKWASFKYKLVMEEIIGKSFGKTNELKASKLHPFTEQLKNIALTIFDNKCVPNDFHADNLMINTNNETLKIVAIDLEQYVFVNDPYKRASSNHREVSYLLLVAAKKVQDGEKTLKKLQKKYATYTENLANLGPSASEKTIRKSIEDYYDDAIKIIKG